MFLDLGRLLALLVSTWHPANPCAWRGTSPVLGAVKDFPELYRKPGSASHGWLCMKHRAKKGAPSPPLARTAASWEPPGEPLPSRPRSASVISGSQGNRNPVCSTFKIGQISDLAQIQLKYWEEELKKCTNIFSIVCGSGWAGGQREKIVSILISSCPKWRRFLSTVIM